jgi:competence ComEA-like helix-hairpin-helix protein
MELTKQERQVILFVLAVSLAGIGIEFLAKKVPPIERRNCLDNLGKVDLNTADGETLKSLPGIGARLAQRIIEYRAEHNGFSELDELAKVKGVKSDLVEKLKASVFVR